MDEFNVEVERLSDGRWKATVTERPELVAYATTATEALGAAVKLALRTPGEPN